MGERFTAVGGRALGRIVSVETGKQLTGTIGGAFMSYVLVAEDHGSTRLLLKVVMRTTRLAAVGLSVGVPLLIVGGMLPILVLRFRANRRARAFDNFLAAAIF